MHGSELISVKNIVVDDVALVTTRVGFPSKRNYLTVIKIVKQINNYATSEHRERIWLKFNHNGVDISHGFHPNEILDVLPLGDRS